MKKLVSVFLSTLLIASLLIGCSTGTASIPSQIGSASEAALSGDEVPEKIVYLITVLGDMSFNDSGWRGVQAIGEKYGYEVQVIEAGEDASKYDAIITDLCDSGVDYIFTSNNFQENIEKYVADYPDIRFIIFDVDPDAEVVSDNVLYTTYAQNEGSYLAGMAAASLSKTGVIGTVGGVQNPVICDFMTGFVEGAKAYNPDIKVTTAWVGNWSDSAKMKELCTTMYNTQNADVFFPIAGGAGMGAFEAAQDIGDIWAIGVDSDQYTLLAAEGSPLAQVIATSMMKEVDNSLIYIMDELNSGNEYWGTVQVFGVAQDSVGVAENEQYERVVSEETRSAIEDAKQKIISGEIEVTSYFDFESEDEYNAFMQAVAP